jgi:RNA polymerase sigma factor (TIGR02999 family)
LDNMTEVTRILCAIEAGDAHAAEQLLPLVYDELRKLAADWIAKERPGQTLQPTALVHEAYLRLVAGGAASVPREPSWHGRGHFFAAAAEAMRRILVERARRKQRRKHGGGRQRLDLEVYDQPVDSSPEQRVAFDEEILALDRALTRLADADPAAAKVVQLRFYAGLSIEQVAETLGVSRATAYRQWAYARAWLRCALGEGAAPD